MVFGYPFPESPSFSVLCCPFECNTAIIILHNIIVKVTHHENHHTQTITQRSEKQIWQNNN